MRPGYFDLFPGCPMFAFLVLLVACNTPSEPATPPATPAATAPAGDAVGGKVLETMDGGGYTYMRLATPTGERWAAVQQAPIAVGQDVTLADVMVMRDFHSPTFDRTFPEILFAKLGSGGGASPHSMGMGMNPGTANPHGAGGDVGMQGMGVAHGAADSKVEEAVPKADGADAYTVAEIVAQKDALVGKEVRLRGKVVKFNGGILGKNWLHLQDGSGSAASNDFDLIATSDDGANVGEIVTVRGKVATNKDLGAGYTYAVLLEDVAFER